MFLLTKLERGNLHDVIKGAGQQLQLTVWPEEFIIAPDPAPPGTVVKPPLVAAGDLLIVAALPDPAGADRGNETVTLLNLTATAIDLEGWALSDAAGGRKTLTGRIDAGAALRVTLDGGLRLDNGGDTIVLVDPKGSSIDQVTYQANRVMAGRTIAFGR
ncbi:lamin tail domain-containing protein [Nonomuraea sp. NPDC050451]|uniref:lamin tail domain-containing protein n=1 Tax=Nonomuraea sp. NPDC050451 TaxID=3364364 RepID=UPI0037928596